MILQIKRLQIFKRFKAVKIPDLSPGRNLRLPLDAERKFFHRFGVGDGDVPFGLAHLFAHHVFQNGIRKDDDLRRPDFLTGNRTRRLLLRASRKQRGQAHEKKHADPSFFHSGSSLVARSAHIGSG